MKLKHIFALLVVIHVLVLALVGVPADLASAGAPPPTITFKGFDDKGCKVFKIEDANGISVINVSALEGNIKAMSGENSDPAARVEVTRHDHVSGKKLINYGFSYRPGFPGVVEITVCPQEGAEEVSFRIEAFDHQDQPHSSRLNVEERKQTAGNNGKFTATYFIFKKFKDVNCDQVKKSVVTDNLKNVEVKCELVKETGFTQVTVSGKLEKKDKPGTAAVLLDPPDEIFLMVAEVCSPDKPNQESVCPANLEMSVVATPPFE